MISEYRLFSCGIAIAEVAAVATAFVSDVVFLANLTSSIHIVHRGFAVVQTVIVTVPAEDLAHHSLPTSGPTSR